MAGICCGVVGESESATTVEPTSLTSRRRRLEPIPFKFVADVAVLPLENGCKRQKLDLLPPAPLRDFDNAVENCDAEELVNHEEPSRKQKSDDTERIRSVTAIKSGESLGSARVERIEPDEWPKFGMTSVCGRRRDMEDAVSIHPSFCKFKRFDFFGVFDGHGCSHVAMKCRDRFHEIVKEELESSNGGEVDWKGTMERSFERMDKEVSEWTESATNSNCRCDLRTPQCEAVGSTAVVAVVTPEKIVVSNCGDSRAVLCRNGVPIPLSFDHKPDRPDELNRIESAGGRVIYWDGPRVLGVLAMSRAIGDSYLKPFVTSEPEVTVMERTAGDECLILASDGLWDVLNNETACGVARMCLRSQKPPSPPGSPGSLAAVEGCAAASSDKACWDASILLTKLALARYSSDNVSVVVVDLRRNKEEEK